jgi:hypothetical protein
MKQYITYSAALFFLISFYACKKDHASLSGGSGGKVTVIAKTYHHTKPIKGTSVFVKYASDEFPGTDTTLYDAHYHAVTTDDSVIVSGLTAGSYYFYGLGVDSAIAGFQNGYNVKGGIPYTVSIDSGTLVITVPITEGD